MKNQELRPGNLNYELKKILDQECAKGSLKEATVRVERRLKLLPRMFGVFQTQVLFREFPEFPTKKEKMETLTINAYSKRRGDTVHTHAVMTVPFVKGDDGEWRQG